MKNQTYSKLVIATESQKMISSKKSNVQGKKVVSDVDFVKESKVIKNNYLKYEPSHDLINFHEIGLI